jgi:CRP/FNR family transcriptional regulator
MKDKLKDFFAHQFEEELINEIVDIGEVKFYREGEHLLNVGEQIDYFPFLLRGVFKVLSEDENGNEVVMYFLERGDTCACVFINSLSAERSCIRAVAEVDSEVILINVKYFDEWLVKYESFRNYVLESYNLRLKEMIEAIDTLAFKKMDQRLLKYLHDKVQVLRITTLNTTHQDIAYDLNTSRVVVSRLLKQLENEGKIILKRNRIEVLNL